MKARTVVILISAAALLGTLGLCGLTTLSTYRWVQDRGLQLARFENVSAKVTETRSYPAGQPFVLEVETDLGDIAVSAHAGESVEVEIIKTGWGETEAEARQAAEAVQIREETGPDRLRLVYREPEQAEMVFIGQAHSDSASFNIKVPANSAVTLHTAIGDLLLRGTTGGAELESSFGQVTVQDLAGGLAVQGSNASLAVESVQAGAEDIRLETSFGGLVAEDLAGRNIHLRSATGEVSARGIRAAGELTLENQFGATKLEDVQAASLAVVSQNSNVELRQGVIEGQLTVQTGFGDLEVQGVQAAGYTLGTSQGKLILEGAQGLLNLTNTFGEILVTDAREAILSVSNQNGLISFTGSLAPGTGHTLETTFDDIRLTIPRDSAFDLSLETQFGKLVSELPVSLSGQVSETSWQGRLNGGGPELRAVTQNGNISILALEQ